MSWREIFGLLIGLAICYGVLSYALANAPQNRAVSEQTQQGSLQEETKQRTVPGAPAGETKTVIVRLAGSRGEPFSANYGNLLSSRTVDGVAPADYEVQVLADPLSGDYVSATAWKTTGSSKELRMQIVDNGRVVKEGSTTEDYGPVTLRWSPGEQPPSETTSPSPAKTK
jgi:hypothetical protein